MTATGKRSWYYFGCHRYTGHHLFDKHRGSADFRDLERFDGQLCPESRVPYKALLTRIPHMDYSALAWWDHTVDGRPGSNSIIFAPSLTCPLESIRTGIVRWFSWVEDRLPQPLEILPGEAIYDVSTGLRRPLDDRANAYV